MNRMIKRIPALLSAAILLLSSCGTAGSQTADSGSAQAQSAASSVSTVAASPRTPAVLDLTGATADTDGTLGWVSISNSLLDLTAGEINILTSYEGLEGTSVSVSGGTIYIVSSDDGVSAAGGADGSGFGGFGRGTPFGGNSGSLFHGPNGMLN